MSPSVAPGLAPRVVPEAALSARSGEAEVMSAALSVIVYPPSPTGGRRVRVDGEILGLAHSCETSRSS